MENNKTKICKSCSKEKELSPLYFQWAKKDVYFKSQCKICENNKALKRREKKGQKYRRNNNVIINGVLHKICNGPCGKMLEFNDVNFKRKNKNRIYSTCRACWQIGTKNYYQENKEKILASRKKRYLANKEKENAYSKQYRINNYERLQEYYNHYYLEHKDEIIKNNNKNNYNRYHKDIFYKLKKRISCIIRAELKKNGGNKAGEDIFLHLEYGLNDLKMHLEGLFESWMCWDNHGVYNSNKWQDDDSNTWTWNIDHIIPQSELLYDSFEHQNFKKCWALENLRPYAAKQNIIDGASRIRHGK